MRGNVLCLVLVNWLSLLSALRQCIPPSDDKLQQHVSGTVFSGVKDGRLNGGGVSHSLHLLS